jgi:ADP-ribose pyrophosphatase YjhB (NUDIX family)
MYPSFALLFLLNSQNELLLLRRINTPFCNHFYSLPRGKIEPGETARKALVREAKNSLNIHINLEDLICLHVMYRKCNEPELFVCVFQSRRWGGTPIN